MSKSYKIFLSVMFSLTLVLSLYSLFTKNRNTFVGSVAQGSEYHSTSTSAVFVNNSVLVSGSGTLGSVVVTVTGTGSLTLYDGTTTLSHPDWATTTLAYFAGSPTVGTYTFDAVFQKGLLVQFGAGTVASTTITFR